MTSLLAWLAIVCTTVAARAAEIPTEHQTSYDLSTDGNGRSAVELDLPDSGLLILELTAPGGGATRPRLRGLERLDGADGGFHWLERSALRSVVAVTSPASYRLWIDTDPEAQATAYRLHARLLPAPAPRSRPTFLITPSEVDEWDEEDGSGKSVDEWDEEDLSGKTVDEWDEEDGSGKRLALPYLARLCERQDGSLYGRIAECPVPPRQGATLFAAGAAAGASHFAEGAAEGASHFANNFANKGSGPVYFAFELDGETAFELRSAGGGDPLGELFTLAGERLAGDDDSGPGRHFALTPRVAAGRYLLRVDTWRAADGPWWVESAIVP